jgi:hypothetical protein
MQLWRLEQTDTGYEAVIRDVTPMDIPLLQQTGWEIEGMQSCEVFNTYAVSMSITTDKPFLEMIAGPWQVATYLSVMFKELNSILLFDETYAVILMSVLPSDVEGEWEIFLSGVCYGLLAKFESVGYQVREIGHMQDVDCDEDEYSMCAKVYILATDGFAAIKQALAMSDSQP